jgi:putative DNA primase/helicase
MTLNAESIARALGRGREKRTPTGFMTLCPVHEDHNPSLSVDEKGGEILVRCRVGCDQTRVIQALRDRGAWPSVSEKPNTNGNGARAGLTLAQFAAAKGFEPAFLSNAGVSEEKGNLVFHYLLMNGQRAARQRIRLALAGQRRFIWNKADGRPVPYGLWRLEDARKRGAHDLFLVEGESDALTLWLHGFTALGVPGSDNCKLLQAPHIAGFLRIFILLDMPLKN